MSDKTGIHTNMKKSTKEIISLFAKLLVIMAIIGWLESCSTAMSPQKAASKGGLKCGKGYIR
jgi:hypothetical protein